MRFHKSRKISKKNVVAWQEKVLKNKRNQKFPSNQNDINTNAADEMLTAIDLVNNTRMNNDNDCYMLEVISKRCKTCCAFI